jgi:lipopolysaccharide transport system ATP-binding protein
MSAPAIRVRNLGKRYRIGLARQRADSLREMLVGSMRRWRRELNRNDKSGAEIWALRDVSFDVQHGDVLGLIGRNGAGKSTLLKILSRITEPTEGEVEIRGRVGSLLEVGTGFHPDLTGRENIFLSGALLGMRRNEIQRKFDAIVDFSGVSAFIHTPVKHYSSGMYTRLAFAVAAHMETEVLLVDEVLAVGDAEFQKKCLGKMGDVAREGRTVVFVSHNLAALQRLCPTSILIDKGRIVASGPSPDIVSLYLRGPAASAAGCLEWRRSSPTPAVAYFERVFVADIRGEPVESVATGDRVKIGLEFVVREVPRELQVSIGLLDGNSGEQIFGSLPQDSGLQPPTTPGRFRAFVELPKDLLMPREYMIRTSLWTPETGTIDSIDVLSFSAVQTASLSNSTPGGRAGLIALRCVWSVEQIEADSRRDALSAQSSLHTNTPVRP